MGEADGLSIIGLGTGIVGGVVAEITVIGLGRDGHVVDVDADPRLPFSRANTRSGR